MKMIYFLTILTILFNSCSVNKEFVDIRVKYNNEQDSNIPVDKTIEILYKRFENIGATDVQIVTENDVLKISACLKSIADTVVCRNLISSSGEFQILESFPIDTVYKYLDKVNLALFEHGNFNISFPDSANEKEALFSVLFPKNSPLFEGVSLIKDTNIVNQVFSNTEITKVFPENYKFLWHDKTTVNEEYLSCGVVNKNNKYEISNQMIKEVKVEPDNYFDTYKATLILKEEFHSLLAKITRENTNKYIAITIDDKICFFPAITGELNNGEIPINHLPLSEANFLKAILGTACLKHKLKIIDFNVKS